MPLTGTMGHSAWPWWRDCCAGRDKPARTVWRRAVGDVHRRRNESSRASQRMHSRWVSTWRALRSRAAPGGAAARLERNGDGGARKAEPGEQRALIAMPVPRGVRLDDQNIWIERLDRLFGEVERP